MPATDSSSNIDRPSAGRESTSGREWQATIEGSRIRKGKYGNIVRSFLIHNGVLLAAGMQT